MANLPQLKLADKRALVEALLACDCLNTPQALELALKDFRSEIRSQINRHPNPRYCVVSLVNVCLKFAAFGELLQIVSFYEGDSLSWQQLQQVISGIQMVVEEDAHPLEAVPHEAHRLHQRCNRTDQSEAFEIVFDEYLRAQPQPPLVCVLHGDELECHGDFVNRLHSELLPALLDAQVEGWPWDAPGPRASVEKFWLELGRAQLNRRFDSAEKSRASLLEKLDKLGSPLLVRVQWLSENFEDDQHTGLANFLQFWENWPALPPNRPVVCTLSLKYQRSKEKSSFWRKSPNARLRNWVTELEKQRAAKPWLAVLPELTAVKRTEAEAWSIQREILRIRDVQEEVSEFYRLNGDRPIEMQRLSKKLKELLTTDY